MVELTRRQQQVYDGLIEGKSYTQIAYELELSDRTIRFYANLIADKLPGTGAPIRKILAYAVENSAQNGHK